MASKKVSSTKIGPIDNIRELCSQIKVFMRFDMAVCDVLDDLQARVYALEEDNKLYKQKIASLEKRYSELLYAFKSYQA